MANKQRSIVEMEHRYNLRASPPSWKKVVAATSLSLFSLYYLGCTFLKSSPTVELHQDNNMGLSRFFQASTLLTSLVASTAAQTPTTTTAEGWSTTLAGTPTSFRSVFTIPASADQGAELIPNIKDPEAINAQNVCPGYKASQLQETDNGISAVLELAGAPCNVYGNDIDVLNLKVEYQSKDRLAINISPAYLVGLLKAEKQPGS